MTNHLNDEFFEEVYRAIRRTPTMWSEMNKSIYEPDFEAIRDLVHNRRNHQNQSKPTGNRIRKKVIAIFAVFTILSGGTLVTARILTTIKPKIVGAGTVCRAESKTDAYAMVSGPSGDPISFCRREWESGQFTKQRGDGPVPPLAACVSKQHIVEIFPGYEEVCGQMGMSIANLELSSYQKAVIELQRRTAEEVNAKCVPIDEGVQLVKKALDQLQLGDWKIETGIASRPGPCAVVGLLETQKLLNIASLEDGRSHEKFISR